MAYIGCEVIHVCSNGYEYYYHEEELIELVQEQINVGASTVIDTINDLSDRKQISIECDKNGDTVYDDGDIDVIVDEIKFEMEYKDEEE
tara:strand:+ start:400 stop:666 length:267 start_codon:yes stop_codon:yes gene_type:complete